MKFHKLISIIIVTLFINACATLKDSILLGGGIGATVGGLLGNATGTSQGNTERGTINGAALGLIVGGLIGYQAYKTSQEKQRMQSVPDVKLPATKVPSLSAPEVRRVWVPAKIEGNKYIDGHYEFIIQRQSVWTDQ